LTTVYAVYAALAQEVAGRHQTVKINAVTVQHWSYMFVIWKPSCTVCVCLSGSNSSDHSWSKISHGKVLEQTGASKPSRTKLQGHHLYQISRIVFFPYRRW